MRVNHAVIPTSVGTLQQLQWSWVQSWCYLQEQPVAVLPLTDTLVLVVLTNLIQTLVKLSVY